MFHIFQSVNKVQLMRVPATTVQPVSKAIKTTSTNLCTKSINGISRHSPIRTTIGIRQIQTTTLSSSGNSSSSIHDNNAQSIRDQQTELSSSTEHQQYNEKSRTGINNEWFVLFVF